MRPLQARAGFTLFELLIVMTLCGLILVAFSRIGQTPVVTAQVQTGAERLAAAFRAARARAITANRPSWVAIDIAQHRILTDTGASEELPSALQISLTTTREQAVSAAFGRFVFDTDGSSSGGRVQLAMREAVVTVAIDWLTGRVVVASP